MVDKITRQFWDGGINWFISKLLFISSYRIKYVLKVGVVYSVLGEPDPEELTEQSWNHIYHCRESIILCNNWDLVPETCGFLLSMNIVLSQGAQSPIGIIYRKSFTNQVATWVNRKISLVIYCVVN